MRARNQRMLGVVVLLTALGTSVAAHAAPDLHLPFNDVDGGTVIKSTANLGTASTQQKVVTSGSGRAVARRSPLPGGQAMGLPQFDGLEEGERAVLAVTPRNDAALNPGSRPFWFQADIRLNSVNSGGTPDNGNNVLQRGLFNGPQYKIQADDDQATCRVAGDRSDILMRHSTKLEAGVWYRVRCRRIMRHDGRDRLRLIVKRLDGDHPRVLEKSEIRSLGALDFDRETPLSVGGKLQADYSIADASDQFNGRIDNVRVVVR